MQIDHSEAKRASINMLNATCNNIVNAYGVIFDDYYKTGSRDSAFLKDLVDCLLGINAIVSDFRPGNGVYPGYTLEKLNHIKDIVESNIRYFDAKQKAIIVNHPSQGDK